MDTKKYPWYEGPDHEVRELTPGPLDEVVKQIRPGEVFVQVVEILVIKGPGITLARPQVYFYAIPQQGTVDRSKFV